MALQLCARADVENWWSADGVTDRVDDNRNDAESGSETAIVTAWIERASAIVASKVSVRYNAAEYGGANPPTTTPPVIMHFTAVIAAYYVGCRRNLPIPASLKEEYERVLKLLDQMAAGTITIPEVSDSFAGGPFNSNFHVDGSYRSTQLRVVPATSSDPPGPAVKHYPERTGNSFL